MPLPIKIFTWSSDAGQKEDLLYYDEMTKLESESKELPVHSNSFPGALGRASWLCSPDIPELCTINRMPVFSFADGNK
jgi:hypothetical protein